MKDMEKSRLPFGHPEDFGSTRAIVAPTNLQEVKELAEMADDGHERLSWTSSISMTYSHH